MISTDQHYALTRTEYDAWVEEHGRTPTWGPEHMDSRPGVHRPATEPTVSAPA